MILDLGNGRELKLPNDMDDETARQLGKLILGLEQRAADAEAGTKTAVDRAEALRTDMQNLRGEVRSSAVDLAPLAGAIAEMQRTMETLLGRVVAAQLADRVIVMDSMGTPRSRAVPK